MKNESPFNWSQEKVVEFDQTFLTWYEQEQRILPWRYDQDPYRIWISEIMLQQTRVSTVIPYFYRFMEWFPTIKALAEAPEDRLLKAWEGLGYYSRARNLQAAAQQIIVEFDGQMPQTIAEVSTLKGIGPYTAGAIGSIAFGLPEPAIDGNVMRVVSRLFCISDDIAKPASRKVFDEVMRQIIDHEQPGEFNQAMMDLGSGICTPMSPDCAACPIQAFCTAYQTDTVQQFPVKSKKPKPQPVYYVAAVIENKDGQFWLEKRPASGLLANMWTFPLKEVAAAEYEQLKSNNVVLESLVAESTESATIMWQKQVLGEITHIFTHLKWHVLAHFGRALTSQPSETGEWVSAADFPDYVFPKPQQKLVELLRKKEYL